MRSDRPATGADPIESTADLGDSYCDPNATEFSAPTRTIERLLSVDRTCRLQCRSLYAYLADALTAKARGDPIPALA
jgi:hypothetical protein